MTLVFSKIEGVYIVRKLYYAFVNIAYILY